MIVMTTSPDPAPTASPEPTPPDVSADAEPKPAASAYVPYVPPPRTGPQALMQPLGFADPLRWLARGWSDMRAHPGIALFYGICFVVMAIVLGAVFRNQPEYTLTIVSGCLLVGPFLTMGLYEVSRRREHGLAPDLGSSLTCWSTHLGSMSLLVLVLIVLELLWGRASLVVFAVFFNTGMPSTTGVIDAVFNPQNWEFVAAYLAVGGIFAALVFSTTVVSIPMILDRDTDAMTASLTSMRAVLENPLVMLWWGALIVLMIGLSMLPWGLGLLVVGPWLGHASWHAYRSAVHWRDGDTASAQAGAA